MADRVAKDRQQAERELNQQIQKFARLMNEGKTGMIDRFGVKIEPGHYVLYRPMHDLIFEVVDVVPSLNPQHMVGTVILKLACATDVQFVAGQRAMTLLKCGQRAVDEEGKTELIQPGSQPASELAGDDPQAEERALSDAAEEAAHRRQSEEPPNQ